jgi:hypothetical protein
MNFWDFFWLMIWGFFFIAYLMVLFQVIVDVFRDSDLNGWAKTVWLVALFIAPPVTALVYLIVRGRSMKQREYDAAMSSRGAAEDYIRSVATTSDPASQIARAKTLLDAGTISQAEFEQLKSKALA